VCVCVCWAAGGSSIQGNILGGGLPGLRLNVSRLLEERDRWTEKERATSGKGAQQADDGGGGRGDAPVVKSARTPLRPTGQYFYVM
jgi:hypothetical protein